MTTSQRRIALLTGASLATLGMAAPAYAATVTVGHILHTGLIGAPNVSDTLTICLATDTCTVGNSGGTSAAFLTGLIGTGLTAAVQQVANATGNATLVVNNAGVANVGFIGGVSSRVLHRSAPMTSPMGRALSTVPYKIPISSLPGMTRP